MTRAKKRLRPRQESRNPLDEQVALRVAGFRWAEWNHALLGGAPLDTPGRFLVRPDHVLGHLQIAAHLDTPLADHPLDLVPHFSMDLNHAMNAAEQAGLFRHGCARLRRSVDGMWWIEVMNDGIRLSNEHLPVLLCEASLAFMDQRSREPAAGRSATTPL
jgi:hypothetical protein